MHIARVLPGNSTDANGGCDEIPARCRHPGQAIGVGPYLADDTGPGRGGLPLRRADWAAGGRCSLWHLARPPLPPVGHRHTRRRVDYCVRPRPAQRDYRQPPVRTLCRCRARHRHDGRLRRPGVGADRCPAPQRRGAAHRYGARHTEPERHIAAGVLARTASAGRARQRARALEHGLWRARRLGLPGWRDDRQVPGGRARA